MADNKTLVWSAAEQRWSLLFLLVSLASLVAVGVWNPGLVVFWPFTLAEFVQFIAPLVVVSLFIERALEVFLTAWRAEGATKLEKRVKRESGSGGAPLDAEHALVEHKAGTQRMAFLGGVTMGVVVSAVGVRALGMLVDPAVFDQLSGAQQAVFNVIDVFLTGAVLGGGADGLHKIVSVFTNFMDVSAKRVKASGPE